ncbi:hypothetical protein EBZ39_00495 [bacterium]|nr:hypothetical protein [bacterium]
MADGKECKCHAHSEAECGCDADWTPQEVYDLRESNARLLGLLADIRAAVGDPTGKLMQDELVAHCRSLRLTIEERANVILIIMHLENAGREPLAATLRDLLKRLG